MQRTRRKEKGMVLVWVAITGIALILVVALAGDTAHVYLAGHQLQNAADAAALGGVWEVRDEAPTAHDAAKRVADANNAGKQPVKLADNLANAPGGDIVIGFWDSGSRTFTPTFTSPNAVRVLARRTDDSPSGALPLIFGPALQINSSNVSRTATAVIGGPLIEAGLILLNREDPNVLDLRGTGSVPARIVVTGGAVQVNSDHPNGTNWSGEPIIDATGLYIGSAQPGAAALLPNGAFSANAPPVPDPLAGLPAPAVPPVPSTPNPDPDGFLKPGYYGKNSWPKNGDVKLAGGIYYIDGGIDTTANIDATAPGTGVLFYFNTGSLVMRGNSVMTIAPMETGTYAGISIFQARGNQAQATIRGSETIASTGVFYFPSAQVTMWGTPVGACTQLIADKLDMRGTGQLTINYNGGNPILGHRIWLVR